VLHSKRNRGWPWPDESWGLTPMYGEDGWCRSCGVPQRPQCGDLVLRSKKQSGQGAWVPNWRFDALCVSAELAGEVRRFNVELRRVVWRGWEAPAAFQLVAPTVGDAWYAPEELSEAAMARHGEAGARCGACATWRWMPVASDQLPPLRIELPRTSGSAVAASPEWFGDGCKAYRVLMMRTELAELLAAASPRDFTLP
jgi:hypothetical protein